MDKTQILTGRWQHCVVVYHYVGKEYSWWDGTQLVSIYLSLTSKTGVQDQYLQGNLHSQVYFCGGASEQFS